MRCCFPCPGWCHHSGLDNRLQAKNQGKKQQQPLKNASLDEEAMPMFTKLTATKA